MRTYRRLSVRLSKRDRDELRDLLRRGIQPVRTVLRALTLLQLDAGQAVSAVAGNVPLTAKAVREIGRRYEDGGLERALYDQQRPGAAPLLEPNQKQRIIAMVCSDPPAGRARWTVRLIAEEAVKRKLVPRAGRETIRVLLESHDLKPWREKNVVRGRARRGLRRQDGGRAGDP
jgi:transposase